MTNQKVAIITDPIRAGTYAEDKDKFLETLKSMHPIGRIADPQEIANAVVWLLSDKSSFVLGHTLLVDGGMISR